MLFFSSLDAHFSELEIGFAIDGSASIQFYGKTNFQKLKDLVTKLTRSFNVSNNETRVGLIVYSTTSTLAFNLDRYSSLNRTIEAPTMQHIQVVVHSLVKPSTLLPQGCSTIVS